MHRTPLCNRLHLRRRSRRRQRRRRCESPKRDSNTEILREVSRKCALPVGRGLQCGAGGHVEATNSFLSQGGAGRIRRRRSSKITNRRESMRKTRPACESDDSRASYAVVPHVSRSRAEISLRGQCIGVK